MATGEERSDGEDGRPELEPIARVLRETYHADNHDTLGRDLTGLMLELARVDDADPVVAAAPVHGRPRASGGWWRRLLGLR